MAGMCLFLPASRGQSVDSLAGKLANFPSKFFNKIQGKEADLNKQLSRQTEKYLQKMAAREARLKKKLEKNGDTTAARTLFAGDPAQRYAALLKKLQSDTSKLLKPVSGPYSAYADSLHGTLSFLNGNPQLLNASKFSPGDIARGIEPIRTIAE